MTLLNSHFSLPTQGRLFDGGVLLAVLLASATAMSLNQADPDLWGHIQYGRDALENGLPATTTYSYIAQGYPWINHEILAEYALAIVHDAGGGLGLMIAKALLGLGVLLLVLRQAREQRAGLIAASALALLVAVSLGRHWTLRPQLASYVSFALLLALLSWCFQGWEGTWQLRWPWKRSTESELTYDSRRLRYLWLVPVLMMAWTNSHGGFLAGLCVYIAYLGLRSLEAISQRGWEAAGLVRRFALMSVAAVTATFINPYGPLFHVWLYHDLKVPRPEILEWRGPDLFDPQTVPFLLMAGLWLASLAFSKRRQDFTQNVILGLIAWQSLEHHRHMAFFAIAGGFWLAGHFQSLLERSGAAAADQSFGESLAPRARGILALGLATAIAICGVQLGRRLSNLQVDKEIYPVAAFDYIAERGLTGRMFVTFNWAQYALAAFGPSAPSEPGLLVHVDGRYRTSYSQAMMDEHFDLILGNLGPSERYRDPKSGPFDPCKALEHGRPDLVLISRLQGPSVEVLNGQRDRWVLLYQDALAQLWGRTTRYGDPRSGDFIPVHLRSVGDAPQHGAAPWPALPHYAPRNIARQRTGALLATDQKTAGAPKPCTN